MNEAIRALSPGHLLTVREVAEILSVHERTVRRLVDCGELPFIRFGRTRRLGACPKTPPGEVRPGSYARFVRSGRAKGVL
ncbi:MAG: helix-turn-helix domain-containing protein [Thermoleophilaceae bacterium]